MPTRGEILQQIYDLAVQAVMDHSSIQSSRDLFGTAVRLDGSADPTRIMLGQLWVSRAAVVGPLLDQIRCAECPTCVAPPPAQGSRARCIAAAVDAVEAFKAGAHVAACGLDVCAARAAGVQED